MHEDLKDIEGLEISFHEKSKRIINIKIEDQVIDRLIFPFKKFDVTALEYKPFTRFTVAKSLDDLSNNRLGNFLKSVLEDRNTGCVIIGPENKTTKTDKDFFIKLSTSVTHLVGIPNHDIAAILRLL